MLDLSEGGIMSLSSPGNGNLGLEAADAQEFVTLQERVGNFQQCHGQGKCSQSGTAALLALGMQPFLSCSLC